MYHVRLMTDEWNLIRMIWYRCKEPSFQLLDYDCYAFEWERYYVYPGH